MIHTIRPEVASRTCPVITVRGSRLMAPPGALTSYSISQMTSRYSPPKAVMSQVIKAAKLMISLSGSVGRAAAPDLLSLADAPGRRAQIGKAPRRVSDWSSDVCSSDLDEPGDQGSETHDLSFRQRRPGCGPGFAVPR